MPFKMNAFAVFSDYPSPGSPTALVKFLNSLVPTQVKAISRLILQPLHFDVCTWNQLKRLTALVTLEYVLLTGHPLHNPHRWAVNMEAGFAEAKLEKLAELPQLHKVNIAMRTFSHMEPMIEGSKEEVPDPVKVWIASAERRMLARGDFEDDE